MTVSKELKFLLTHSSIYGLGTVVSRLVAFLLLPLYTRYLNPSDYGVLETIDISTGIIGVVLSLGIATALSRFFYESEATDHRNRTVTTTYISYVCFASLMLPGLMVASNPLGHVLLGSGELYGYYFKISFSTLVLGGAIDIGLMYLRLLKKPSFFISLTISRLLCLIGLNIVFIVYLKMGVLGILYSSLIVGGLFASALTAAILCKTGVTFSVRLAKDMLLYSLPLVPSNLAMTAVKQSDKYFVLYLLSVSDMGIYSLALKLGNTIHNFITVPLNMSYIPRRFEIMKRDEAKKIYSRIFTYYVFVVTYVGLIVSIFIPEILRIMVTPKFFRAAELVPLVVLSMIIFGCHYHFNFGILQSKKTKYLAYVTLISAVLQIGLSYVFIKYYGLQGGVFSAVVVMTIQAFMLHAVSQKFYPIDYELKRVATYFGLAVFFYGISRQIGTGILLLDVAIKFGLIALFPVIGILLKIISAKEKDELLRIWNAQIKARLSGGIATSAS